MAHLFDASEDGQRPRRTAVPDSVIPCGGGSVPCKIQLVMQEELGRSGLL